MILKIYGESIQGASHIRNGMPCQDSHKYVKFSEEISIVAVADGHGSDKCPYSKTGARIATNVFCKIIEDNLKNFQHDMEFFMTYLNREGELKIAQSIENEWKRRVWKAHLDNKREKPFKDSGEIDKDLVYKQYGTTLLGLLITPIFIFAFQLGDGDMMYITDDVIRPIIEGDKILGTETHSLCKVSAWEKAITLIRNRNIEENRCLYLISTDGFSNSYSSNDEYKISCRDYYNLIKEYGFKAVSENLRYWLKETSDLGCGDDITVVLIYFDSEEVLE